MLRPCWRHRIKRGMMADHTEKTGTQAAAISHQGRVVIVADPVTAIGVGREIVIIIHHGTETGMVQRIKTGITIALGIGRDIVAVSAVAEIEIWSVIIVAAAKAGRGDASVPLLQYFYQDAESHTLGLKRHHHP